MSGLERVILLGENHHDPFNFERYTSAFIAFNFDTFTFEMPKSSESVIDNFDFTELNGLNDNFIKLFLSLDFFARLKALKKFSKKKKSEFLLIDLESCEKSDFREENYDLKSLNDTVLGSLKVYSNILNYVNLRDFKLDLRRIYDAFSTDETGVYKARLIDIQYLTNEQLSFQLYGRLELSFDFLKSGFDEINYDMNSFDEEETNYDMLRERDNHMINQILNLSGTVLHGGGISHFFANYDNMYEKLKRKGQEQGFEVERYLLPEMDDL